MSKHLESLEGLIGAPTHQTKRSRSENSYLFNGSEAFELNQNKTEKNYITSLENAYNFAQNGEEIGVILNNNINLINFSAEAYEVINEEIKSSNMAIESRASTEGLSKSAIKAKMNKNINSEIQYFISKEDNDEKRKDNAFTRAKNFIKKVFSAIIAAVKNIVKAIFNLIKSVVNWIKSKEAVAQAKFFKDNVKNLGRTDSDVKNTKIKTIKYNSGLISNIKNTIGKVTNSSNPKQFEESKKLFDKFASDSTNADFGSMIERSKQLIESVGNITKELTTQNKKGNSTQVSARAYVRMALTGSADPKAEEITREAFQTSVGGFDNYLSESSVKSLVESVSSAKKNMDSMNNEIKLFEKVVKKIEKLNKKDPETKNENSQEYLTFGRHLATLGNKMRDYRQTSIAIVLDLQSTFFSVRKIMWNIFQAYVKDFKKTNKAIKKAAKKK